MKFRKPIGIGLLIFVCIGGFFAWRIYSNALSERLTLPLMIHVKGRTYAEIRSKLVQEKNISLLPVTSCEGLAEIGPVDDAGEETFRGLYDAHYTSATIPDVAYRYPDPDYPNLAVAIVDGSPAYFELIEVEHMTAGEMQKLFGSLPVKKLILRNGSNLSDERAITDPDIIAQLFDAINALPQDSWGSGGSRAGNPLCKVTAVLSNGCEVELTYRLKDPELPDAYNAICIGAYFETNEAIDAWFAANFK